MFATSFVDLATTRVFKTGSFYLGLSSTLPTETGTNVTEPTAASYARKLIVFGGVANGKVSNSEDIEFETGDDDWGAIPYYVLYDSELGGTFYGWNNITNKPVLVPGAALLFRAGTVELSIEDISDT